MTHKNTLYRIAATMVVVLVTIGTLCAQSLLPIQDTYDVVSMCKLEKYAGGQYVEISTIPTWKTDFAFYYERERALGKADAEIARATPLVAAVQHIVWGTSANGVRAANISRANLYIGHGQFAVNRHMDWAYAKVTGNGPGNVFANSMVPRGAGGTEVVMWIDKWMYDPACKVNLTELGPQDNIVACAFRSVTFNAEGTVGAYHELAGMDAIHISSNAPSGFKAGRIVTGWLAWDLGSASALGNVYVNNVDCAFIFTRGTPGQIEKVTGMGGNVALFLFLGTCDALYDLESFECDDFPAVYMTRAQWGREAGVRLQFDAGKIETGITAESRNPWTGTIFADLKGRNTIEGGVLNLAQANVKIESVIVVDDRDGNGVSQPNLFRFTLGRWTLDANLIHEVGGNVYGNPAVFQWDGQEVFYKRFGAKRTVQVDREPLAPLPGVVGYKSRLGFQRWNGTAMAPAFSHSAGTPVFKYSSMGGTIPPPTPVPPVDPPIPPVTPPSTAVKWSTQFDGTAVTKLMTGTAVNATAAANWSGLTAVKSGVGTTGPNTIFPAAIPAATRIVYRGCTFKSASDWSYLNSAVRVMADGQILWSATGAVLGHMPKVKADVVITFPAPVDLTTVIGMPGNSAPVFSVEAMEIW